LSAHSRHPFWLAKVLTRPETFPIGEVSWTAWPEIYPGKPHLANLRSPQKFEKV
jgi:hypothetical protein